MPGTGGGAWVDFRLAWAVLALYIVVPLVAMGMISAIVVACTGSVANPSNAAALVSVLRPWLPLVWLGGSAAGWSAILAVACGYGGYRPGLGGAGGGALFRDALIGFLLGLALVTALAIFVMLVPVALPKSLAGLRPGPAHALDSVALVGFAAVMLPTMEEFIFRGLMFDALTPRLGILGAAALVSALFVVLHLPKIIVFWPVAGALSGLALLTVGLRIRSNSLIPPICCHMAYNGAVLLGAGLIVH